MPVTIQNAMVTPYTFKAGLSILCGIYMLFPEKRAHDPTMELRLTDRTKKPMIAYEFQGDKRRFIYVLFI